MTALGGPLRQGLSTAQATRNAARRKALDARLAVLGWQAGGSVVLDAPSDLVVGRGIRVQVDPGSHTTLRFGTGCTVDDRVLLMCKGGALEAGDRVELRRDVVLNLTGTLVIEGRTPVSWGSVLHCSERIHLEQMVGLAERVTIADSSHYFTEPDEHFWHNTRTRPVRIGRNTWLCPGAVVTSGADIGSHCIVGSASVVNGVVPDGHLASGVPATVRPLPLPWR